MERDCPRCGYGIMELVTVVDVEGVWEEGEEQPRATKQKQKRVWRCIDCLKELEADDGEKT